MCDLGQPLRTLHDAGRYITDRLGEMKADRARDYAAELLLSAAESGDPAEIAAATDQVARCLSVHRLLSD